jgi:anti-sigma28 factor (negative regulator of flagellin synthesis)
MDRLPGMEECPFQSRRKGVVRNEVMIMEIKRVADAYQAMAFEPSAVKSKKSAPAKPAEPKQEKVELSEKSQNLQKVKEAINAAPDIRIPMVEKIMERIKNNDYPIDTHLDRAIDNMLNRHIL